MLKAPKYNPGQVIDLGFKYMERMPTRIKILQVSATTNSDEWKYLVLSECTGEISVEMTESVIYDSISRKSAQCYDTEFIKKLIANGFRYCGNMPELVAVNKAMKLSESETIEEVRLYDAINSNGNKVADYYGVWVKYKLTLDINGNETNNTKFRSFMNGQENGGN